MKKLLPMSKSRKDFATISALGLSFCRHRTSKHYFSTALPKKHYNDTVHHLKIGSHTRVIFQGFTGRQATQNAQESLEYGTQILGGVKPGIDGEHLGLPVLPNVRAAKEALKPDATAVYVAANQAAAAIEEAVAAEIPLIVAVAEHIPLHDMLRIQSILRSQSASRLVGANSPGIISAVGKCRIGFHPLPIFMPGCVGIVARSGTLSYEAVASTTRAGLGQSLVIGMGGDILPGTDFVDALRVFEGDEDTKGIILIGEIGGEAEENAAQWISDYQKRNIEPKPIMALVAGIQAVPGRIMGHSGAFVSPRDTDAESKARCLKDAGAVMEKDPSKFGKIMAELLEHRSVRTATVKPIPSEAQPSPRFRRSLRTWIQPKPNVPQHRHFVTSSKGHELLAEIHLTNIKRLESKLFLAIRIDRKKLSPRVYAKLVEKDSDPYHGAATAIPRKTKHGSKHYTFLSWNSNSRSLIERDPSLNDPIKKLLALFHSKEMYFFETWWSQAGTGLEATWRLSETRCGFDEAAYKSCNRQQEIHQDLKSLEAVDPQEATAKKDGIVYIKLQGSGTIGTLVNGAGLAMNTNDLIAELGGDCANFLDTGGKATSETVKTSFKVILQDPRVKAIFVNIFGGLTLCDMIAEGIMLAYKDLGIKLPVVVRLRGTNEKIGQKMIAESGLPLYAYDDFDQAARKVIKLSRGANSSTKSGFEE